MTRSYKPEVIADSSGVWTGNALRFATEVEAHRNVSDLSDRWTAVRDIRVTPSDDAPNYTYHDGKLERIAVNQE